MDNRTAEFLSFNSTLVQLKVEIEPGVWVTQVGFNSTLVQLKVFGCFEIGRFNHVSILP